MQKLHRLHGSTHPYMQTSLTLSIPSRTYSPQMGNGSKMLSLFSYMLACATYAYQESLQREEYSAYHIEECTNKQHNLGEMEGILPEADG